MQRAYPLVLLAGLAACTSSGGYMTAQPVYAEPVQYVYVAPVDHVVVVSRDVLVTNGYTVYRVTHAGPNRVLWARRGDNEMVRLYITPNRDRVAVRGLVEVRERGPNRRWHRRGSPDRVLSSIHGKLKRR